MKDKIEVSSITLTIKGNKVSLTVKEAKSLRDELNKVFPPNVSYPYPVIIDRTPLIPVYPGWTYCGDGPNIPERPLITCEASTSLSY